ncbi:MAG: ABC transporter permease [Verrucomicrobiales bacterium]
MFGSVHHHATIPFHRKDFFFVAALAVMGGSYLVLIVAMLAAQLGYTDYPLLLEILGNERLTYAIKLSLISCTVSTILSVLVAVPLAYLLCRVPFPGKGLVNAVLDIPIILPPLVIGLALLMLFQTPVGRFIQSYVTVTYAIPGLILAQFTVACAFAVRTMMTAFSEIDVRREQVALTLGCSRAQAFNWIVVPEARRGMVAAATIAWARAMGEFGPVLVFAGTTSMRTEVMPTAVFLELNVGNLRTATALALYMIVFSMVVLLLMRLALRKPSQHD